ncbi:MAG TPA: DUF2079 domain-containing protein [Micromonosporaceae bacterium]
MSIAQQSPPRGASEAADRPAPTRVGRRADLTVTVVFAVVALGLTSGLWLDPGHRVLAHNQGDQALFEWLLSYAAYALTHAVDPLWTTLLNSPDGVNLAVNTSDTVTGVVLAPVTLTLGAPVAYATALTLNLALTPIAWYLLLSRTVIRSRLSAAVGAAVCGYGPGMMSHANGHLNFTAEFVVPAIIWAVLGLRDPDRWLRRGLLLGVLVAVQYSLGAETLFFTALALAVFVATWAYQRRAAAREAAPVFLRGLGVAALVAVVLLAYPLWLQFAGPQRYHGTGFDQRAHSEDLLAFGAFPHQSLAGALGFASRLAVNLTEENSFFGLPLLIVVVAGAVALRRRVPVRALMVTAGVAALLALGPRLKVAGHRTPVPLPYAALAKLPLFDSGLPGRLALVLLPIAGVLVALMLDRLPPLPRSTRRGWLLALAVALLPLVPVPLATTPRAPVPVFISSGDWRRYLPAGTALASVPPASDRNPDGQRWQAAARFGFAIPAGFFLGPGGPDGRGRIGPVPRPTAALLTDVAAHGGEPVITEGDRARARADLAYWHAGLVVLSDGGPGSRWTPHHDELLRTVTALLGPGRRVDDVWLWQVG